MDWCKNAALSLCMSGTAGLCGQLLSLVPACGDEKAHRASAKGASHTWKGAGTHTHMCRMQPCSSACAVPVSRQDWPAIGSFSHWW